jgi:hypothetical protein
MASRGIDETSIVKIIEGGAIKSRDKENRFWVYKGSICLSIVIEKPNLVVITAMIQWRPT